MSPETAPVDPAPQVTAGRSKRPRQVGLCRLGVADLLGISVSSVDRMNAAGLLPRPLKLGGSLRWNKRELLAWFDHGSPDRKTWRPIWSAAVRARRTGGGRR